MKKLIKSTCYVAPELTENIVYARQVLCASINDAIGGTEGFTEDEAYEW